MALFQNATRTKLFVCLFILAFFFLFLYLASPLVPMPGHIPCPNALEITTILVIFYYYMLCGMHPYVIYSIVLKKFNCI